MSKPPPGILVTCFEPSGDALAARLVREVKAREPDRPIYALGGPKLQAAGAEMIELSTEHPVMLMPAVSEVLDHRRRLKLIERWLGDRPLAAFVPTDSPAANWGFCKLIRRLRPDTPIVHLAAPQLWAWASWRIRKLRRLTDHVMCLLPFEPDWFEQRGVTASFVGHPLYEDNAEPSVDLTGLPESKGPKLALLPGSRTSEVRNNWQHMLAVYDQLQARYPELTPVIAASDERREGMIRQGMGSRDLPVVLHRTPDVLAWADLTLIVSGTATLQASQIGCPMVSIYNVSRAGWETLGKRIVSTRTFTLPNLIGQSMGLGRVIPEFVPHFRDVPPVVDAVAELIDHPAQRVAQRDAFEQITATFEREHFAENVYGVLQAVMKGSTVPDSRP